MCGIAGFYNVQDIRQDQIDLVTAKLKHRGPDDQQFYKRDDVGLIHTRLSIIELSPLGAQPYKFENLVLIYNGELYNYRDVRKELEKHGYSFKSNSDTEVLIKAFHLWKEQCVDHFIGMFAFSIYDEEADELYVFRDRLGVKPVYYSFSNEQFFFASELKALSVFNLSKEINLQAVALYFRFGFIPGHLSIYQSVSKLQAGHYLRVSRKGIVVTKYWEVQYVRTIDKEEAAWVDELESLMISAFGYRMIADVPVGVFLSGGIDSSLVTSILQKTHGGLHTFTIGFDESDFNEAPYASRIASMLGTNHTEQIMKIGQAQRLLTNFYDVYDEPFADTSGIPTMLVTKLAKERGMKVVLSADGGDELFAGYTHYQKALTLYHNIQRLPQTLRQSITKTSAWIIPSSIRQLLYPFNLEHKSYAFEEVFEAGDPTRFFEAYVANQSWPEIEKMIVGSARIALGKSIDASDPMMEMMRWDLHHYLPDDLLVKVDRATMFHSIECREPFLDHRLVQFSATIPRKLHVKDGKGKYLLRKLLERYLPLDCINRKKQGFSIPIFAWFSTALDELFDQYFSSDNFKSMPFLNEQEIRHEHKKYRYNKRFNKAHNIEKMWRILSFMMWWEKYMKNGR